MKIIGFVISKILVERKNSVQGKIEIKSDLNIDDIRKDEINISEKPSLNFDFSFSLNYSPDIAKLEIKGSVITIDDKDEAKEILKEWKKKKFTHEVRLSLFNFIMNKCNIKAIQLEDELGLPLHIPFPKLAPANQEQENKANYTG
jgi:hypothetical protein